MTRRPILIALLLLAAGCFVGRLLVGERPGWPDDGLILNLRLAAACAAAIVGVCLAVSGVFLQSLLRNPLASPYILGLAAGAGLGVAVTHALWAGDLAAPWWLQHAGAVGGSLVILALVCSLAQRRGMIDPATLLLVGVMLSAICGSLFVLIQFLVPPRDTVYLLRWIMGRIDPGVPEAALALGAVAALVGVGAGLVLSRGLDAAALSDDEATSVGVRLHGLRWVLFILAGTLTAVAVGLAGPIGFVGLIAPHLARRVVGPRHVGLILGAAFIGAALLLAADAAVQALPRPRGLLPVGIITTGIGGPLFIYLLRRERPLNS